MKIKVDIAIYQTTKAVFSRAHIAPYIIKVLCAIKKKIQRIGRLSGRF
jgi:hypothetical protein